MGPPGQCHVHTLEQLAVLHLISSIAAPQGAHKRLVLQVHLSNAASMSIRGEGAVPIPTAPLLEFL